MFFTASISSVFKKECIPQVEESTLQNLFIRRWLLGAILLGLLILKLCFNPYPVGDFAIDGSFYYQIARHVSEGHGLLTSVSLYHQGIKDLPQPSTIYPLWPLVLGAGGAVIGIEKAAQIIPEIFFLSSLFLLYFLTNSFVQAMTQTNSCLVEQGKYGDVGHWAVLLFGGNVIFFKFTSLPYTEALAFFLTFAALLILTKLTQGPSIVWGVFAGTLASLAYLTRTQMVGVSVAIIIILFLVSIKYPAYRRTALATTLAIGFPIVVWIGYLLSIAHPFQTRMLLDFAAYHETAELTHLHYLVNSQNFLELIGDRCKSFWVAFDLFGSYSYVRLFGLSAYLPLIFFICLFGRSSKRFQTLWGFITPQSLPLLSAVLAAIICLAPVHAFHADYFMPYLFHWRHGLPLILLIVIAFGYFSIQHDPWLRHGAALFMVLSLSANAGGVIGAFMKEGSFQGPIKSEREFVQWLSQQEPKPLLVTTRPQALGAHTEGRFHWVRCKESREQMLAYLRVVQVDHLITMENEEKCSFYLSIAEYLMPIQEFKDEQRKITVWRVLERGLQDGIASDISRNIKKNRKDLSIEGDYKVQKGRA